MVDCRYLLKRLSASVNDATDLLLKNWIEEALDGCHRCHVVVGSPRAAVRIYSERGMLEVPSEMSRQAHRYLLEEAA